VLGAFSFAEAIRERLIECGTCAGLKIRDDVAVNVECRRRNAVSEYCLNRVDVRALGKHPGRARMAQRVERRALDACTTSRDDEGIAESVQTGRPSRWIRKNQIMLRAVGPRWRV